MKQKGPTLQQFEKRPLPVNMNINFLRMNNSKNPPVNRRLCFFFIFILAQCGSAFGQGMKIYKTGEKIYRQDGHFVAALRFINGAIGTDYGYFPHSYKENGIEVSGLGRSGTLVVDWWTLFEPTENYIFQWESSGSYEVNYRKVNRSELSKYPDLLKRFDALKPLDIQFEIDWKLNEASYDNLPQTFKEINRAGQLTISTHTRWVTTAIKNGMLFEAAGVKPYSVPGIRGGNGTEFIEASAYQHSQYSSEPRSTPITDQDKKAWVQQFNKAPHIIIESYRITSIKWPVGEMKAIKDLYDQYEKGEKEPTPLEQVEEALAQSEKLSAYNGEGFWGEAYEEERINLEIEKDREGRYVVKNNGKVTYTTSLNRAELSLIDPNLKYLKLSNWYTEAEKYYKNYVGPLSATYLIDYKGNIQSIDGKTLFDRIGMGSDVIELYSYRDIFNYVKQAASGSYLEDEYKKEFYTLESAVNYLKNLSTPDRAYFGVLLMGIAEYEVITIDKKLNILRKERKYLIRGKRRE